MQGIFLEAENFENPGGWLIDQQSVRQMGSPYIMAHGLGIPVADAETAFYAPLSGQYTFWARTRDWTAPWGRLQAGRFSMRVDGRDLPEILGTDSSDWHWQRAGSVRLTSGRHRLALHDLTGFDGRCDAVYIAPANESCPPHGGPELAEFRRRHICPKAETCATTYDLIVAGGGIAGICTALAAARSGGTVLLIHDREILGGCNSSEIRVCLGGQLHLPPYEKLGNIVKEIQPVMGDPSLFREEFYEDNRKKFAFMLQECPGVCHLALGEQVIALTADNGYIRQTETVNIRTGKRKIYKGSLFADCTGDAVLARMAGADVMYGREAASAFGESLGAKTHEKLVMGHSIRWYAEKETEPSAFPAFDTGMFQKESDCLHVVNGDWEQETGFRRDMAEDTEYIRDYGLFAIYGNWSYQKNRSVRKADYASWRLKWVSHLGGKRESYRTVGDLILTQNDIEKPIIYPDATACMTWSIDLHFPEATNEATFGDAFRSFAYHRGIGTPYPVPYRCLYARDVRNLFLGGRTISVSHVAFSAVRVMRTLGMLGEVAGLASTLCTRLGCTPRDVYEKHLDALKELLSHGVPSPDAFNGGIGNEEAYHFKDAGWFYWNEPQKLKNSIFREKILYNIGKLNLRHKYENAFGLATETDRTESAAPTRKEAEEMLFPDDRQ